MANPLRFWILALCAACGGDGTVGGSTDANPQADADETVTSCEAPDVLVLLDRTASMAERPDGTMPANTPAGHAEAKWSIAIGAVEALAIRFETSIRFGLALFPRAPTTGCITMTERIAGDRASNPQCQAGELLVAPAATTGTAIASELDPETTLLCTSTPIGAGLATARTELAAIRDPVRPQFVLFVGDGADTCAPQLALTNTDALAADGVKTYVVAFDANSPAGIDKGLLNDMACAGQTAPGFPAGCTPDAAGNYRATDRLGAALFLAADNATALASVFEQVAGTVCCGCIL